MLRLLVVRCASQSKPSKKTKNLKAVERNQIEKLMFGGVIETKIEKKKREKKEKSEGKRKSTNIQDAEAYWLANLDFKNLKLFRKTSTGRYKEVDIDKLLDVLVSSSTTSNTESNTKKNTIVLPDILVRNLTTYPLLNNEQTKGPQETVNYPSVTHILSETMSTASKEALLRWKMGLIAELGEEGFLLHQKAQLNQGSSFHTCVRRYLETKSDADVLLDSSIEGCWESVSGVLKQVSDVKSLEKKLHHPSLHYKGVVDCVASYQNIPSVIEWKKSEKPKRTLTATYDAPLQLCAYLGAISSLQLQQPVQHGVVVVAYTDGSPANVFSLDLTLCNHFWGQWLLRLQQYWLGKTARN